MAIMKVVSTKRPRRTRLASAFTRRAMLSIMRRAPNCRNRVECRAAGRKAVAVAPACLRAWGIKAISKLLPGSLRLAAQDVALSRRKQGFESPRERQLFQIVT